MPCCVKTGFAGDGTHPQVLVGLLLVLLGHGGWWTLGEVADGSEDTEGCCDTDHGVGEDLPALSWWSLGAWSVWAKGDPVSCDVYVSLYSASLKWRISCISSAIEVPETQLASRLVVVVVCICGRNSGQMRTGLLLLESQLSPVALHAVAESHPQISLLLRWHGLPSLLNVGEGWVGDGVGGAAGSRSYDAAGARSGDGAGNWSAEHGELVCG